MQHKREQDEQDFSISKKEKSLILLSSAAGVRRYSGHQRVTGDYCRCLDSFGIDS